MHRTHGTYHPTGQPLDLSIRGTKTTRRHTTRPATSTIALQLSRSFDGADQDALRIRRGALMAKDKSLKHVTQLSRSQPMSASSQSGMARTIYTHEYSKKIIVLTLKDLELSAIERMFRNGFHLFPMPTIFRLLSNMRSWVIELKKTKRLAKQLQACLEDHCRRAVWVNQKTVTKRGVENTLTFDDVTFALRQEGQVADQALLTVSKHHASLTRASTKLHTAIKKVASTVKNEKRGLALNSEAFGGTILYQPRPHGTPPPAVQEIRDAIGFTETVCSDAAATMQSSKETIDKSFNAVNEKLKASIQSTKNTHADLLQTLGETRCALLKTNSTLERLETTEALESAPRERRFMTTAESLQPPRIRVFHASQETQGRNKQRQGRLNDRNAPIRQDLSCDVGELKQHQVRLESAAHDCMMLIRRDEKLLHFRRRCGPGRPVPTHP